MLAFAFNRLKSGRTLRMAVLSVAFLCLACCSPDPGLIYTAPQNLSTKDAASLIGSSTSPESGMMKMHLITYVISIDNLQTNNGPSDSHTPLLLNPGTHLVQVGACDQDFFGSCDWYGSAMFSANFAAGQTYTMRVVKDPPKRLLADYRIRHAWISDSAGNSITPVAPMADNGPKTSTVPIFIPVK